MPIQLNAQMRFPNRRLIALAHTDTQRTSTKGSIHVG